MFERGIVGDDRRVIHVATKRRFEYWNGSVVAYGGMKDREQREQIRSIGQDGGVDFIWMEEATAFDESDFNELLPRLRGRAAPWRQLILTTNPDSPLHWIYQRLILKGEAVVYHSSASDNSYNPDDYQDTLDSLTGTEGQRLGKGLWIQAEGVIYDRWVDGPDGNVQEGAGYVEGGGPVLWFVDDGYTGEIDKETGTFTANSHPRVFLLAQLRPDGRICVFHESYAIHKLAGTHIDEVLALGYPAPEYAVVDKAAAHLKGEMHERGIYTRNSPSSVDESTKELQKRLSADENGYREIWVHPDCYHLRREMGSYVRDKRTEAPIKQFDHGPDALRYGAWATRYGE